MIYLKLMGRIGNQLFMYAAARALQEASGNIHEIVIEDYQNAAHDNIHNKYENSLVHYPLKNVRYIHDQSEWKKMNLLPQRALLYAVYQIEKNKNDEEIRCFEERWQGLFCRFGLIRFLYGYRNIRLAAGKTTVLSGYFQSEKYFEQVREELIDTFSLNQKVEASGYQHLEQIKKRNSVCISIKVQHNAGNPEFDVCRAGYYAKAIQYILERVENPLFFVCSDNVDYVLKHLIDADRYDIVLQDQNQPVHISLAVMAKCRHFIIGNTSFGWWAQYLSRFEDKIVIAPSRWYNNRGKWQYDIYQNHWVTMED